MKKHTSAIIFLFVPIILALLACGKKESEEQAKDQNPPSNQVALLDSSSEQQSLLKKLPANTLVYGFVDLENAKYQSFINSPFAKYGNILDKLSGEMNAINITGKEKLVQNILSKFSDPTGQNFLSLYRQSNDKVSSYLLFISGDTAQDMTFNIFAYAKEKKYFVNNFEQISQNLLSTGLLAGTTPTEELGETRKSFKIPETDSQVHLIADAHHLAISTSITSANRLFTKQEASEEYDLKANLPSELIKNIESQPMIFAVANFEKILQLFPGVGLANPKFKQLLNLIPRQALITSDFDNAAKTKISMHIPKSSLPINLQTVFDQSSAKAWDNFSTNTFLAWDLNLGVIKKIIGFLITDVIDPKNPTEVKALNDYNNFLPENGELGLALTNFNITGFPDLQLTLPLVNAPEKVAFLKSLLANQKNPVMGNIQWQEKLIADQPVEYIITPFGVGLYLNTSQDLVRVGTSEMALKELITPTAKLLASLESDLEFKPVNTISSFYLDYSKLYRVAQSFRSMMSMFIPPDQGSEVQTLYQRLEELKGLVIFADSSYQNDVLEFGITMKAITPQIPHE